MYNDITGIILCGGKSSRMGVNKAFLKLGGSYIIETISKLLKDLFERVIVITNDTNLYKFLELDLYEDIYKGKGPLGGIHSGLIHSKTEENFIMSCDIPLISKETIKFITDFPSAKSIKVPNADGYIQHLCGIYSKSCLSLIDEILCRDENHINKKECKVSKLVELACGEIINIEIDMPGYEPNSFLNTNSRTQYKKVERIYEGRLSFGD